MSDKIYVIEEMLDGKFTMMVEEGLCNPYTDKDRAWIDYQSLKQSMGINLRLVETERVNVLDGWVF